MSLWGEVAAALIGPPPTKCATFSKAFGIPAPNAPRFFGVARFEEVGLHGRLVALLTVDGPLVRIP